MKKSSCYVTSDGEIHSTIAAAREHAAKAYHAAHCDFYNKTVENEWGDINDEDAGRVIFDWIESHLDSIAQLATLKADMEES